tara:strand:+ start:323 stop:895 length:573 start_codon:yes stop_codon:yes gene_type:complete
MNLDTFKIWFAGFYEGEGCVCNDKSNNNRIVASVSQNDITPLQKASEIWGGRIVKRTRQSPASEKICISYEWRLSHNHALQMIKDIRPFLIIPYKIHQIDEALKKAEEGHSEKYQCSFCEKCYANPSGRRRLEMKDHISKGSLHVCNICHLTYSSKDTLIRHIRNIHKNTDASPEIFESLGEVAQLRETP